MITLKITYSPEAESRRAQYTLGKLAWYKNNGYDVGVPRGLKEKSTEDEVRDAVASEYREEEYAEYADMLSKLWAEFAPRIERTRQSLPFPLLEQYTIVLTQYGTAGSYFPEETKIIVNLRKKNKDTILGTLVHEMTHIAIEPLIQKYKVPHFRKERLVDLLCDAHFREIRSMKAIPEDVSMVDKAFAEKYPDVEEIVKAIA